MFADAPKPVVPVFVPNPVEAAGVDPNREGLLEVLFPNKLVVLDAPAPKPVLVVAPKPVDGAAAPKPVPVVVLPKRPPVAGFWALPNKPPPVLLLAPNPVFVVAAWPNGFEVVLEAVLPKRLVPVEGVAPKAGVVCWLLPKPPNPVDWPKAPA